MRKDYIVNQRPEDEKTAFVERFWTEASERDGGGESEIAKVPRKEEFHHLSRALSEFDDGLQPCPQEARRILKPGGRLLISVPFDNLRHSLRAAAKTRPQTESAADLRFYLWRLSRAELTLEMARALSLALSPFLPDGLAGLMLIASGTRHADPAGTESA